MIKNENKFIKNVKTANKGITLIALVITIIILLILAGVSISMLTGENGILTQVSKAKEQNELAEVKEQAKLDIMAWRAEEIANGRTGALDDEIVKRILKEKNYVAKEDFAEDSFKTKDGHTISYKDLYTEQTTQLSGDEILTVAPTTAKVTKNTKYQDALSGNKIAVIPSGFAVVPECTKIDDGLVISDVANDTEDIGNQFVWIPVSKENFATEFVRREGYVDNQKKQDISNYGEANSTGVNTNSSITERDETQAEAKTMYASVLKNGGFYIGRYEAGNEGGTLTVENNKGTWDNKGEVVVKKNVQVYNYIGWNNDTTNNDITVETGGAVELARNFATQQGYDTTQVHSTLCYAVQWDTALNFIDPGYTGYAKNSDKMGWHSDNYNSTLTGNTETNPNHMTGKDLIYADNPTIIANKHKNIYDMGGNVVDWTMESCYTLGRTYRGGNCGNTGSNDPASRRNSNNSSNSSGGVGFRIALYL